MSQRQCLSTCWEVLIILVLFISDKESKYLKIYKFCALSKQYYMMMFFIGILFIMLMASESQVVTNQKIMKIDGFHLHEYNVKGNWEYIKNKFKAKQIQQLHIQNCIIAQAGVKKLFSQYNMDNLKILNISQGNTVHPKAINHLLSQKYIYNSLQTLILNNCNLQCQDFEVFKNQSSKISKLSLKQNFISYKGFQYLSRLKINLTSLVLQGNSLVHSQSINSLISLNLKNLEELNLGRTSVSHSNLLKILSEINNQKLVNLTINKNLFPAQFYEQFTKIKFPSLQYLNLYGLIISDDEAKYFQTFKLPSLKVLNIHQNQFSTSGLKKFLLKANYPALQKLDLNLNFVNSQIFTHMKKQNFTLNFLKLRVISMDVNGLKQLALMDLSKLQYLVYSHCTTSPEIVKFFFETANLTNLRQLHIPTLANAGSIFEHVMKANLPNLQVLDLPDIGEVDRSNLLKKSNLFPKLRVATFKIYDSDFLLQKNIMQNIHKLAPNLEQFHFYVQQSGYLIQNLMNGSLKIEVHRSLTLNIFKFDSKIMGDQNRYLMRVKFEPNKKTKILNLFLFVLIAQIQIYMVETNRLNVKQFLKSQEKFTQNMITMYLNNFDYSEMVALVDTPKFMFLRWYTNINKDCKFLNLTTLNIENITKQNMDLINRCQIPILKDASMKFQGVTQINFSKFIYLENFHFTGLTKETLLKFFKVNKLQYLKTLTLGDLKLEPKDMEEIFSEIPEIKRIRNLNLEQNFINKNLTFLFQPTQLRLRQLKMDRILFNENIFESFCSLNYQFIQTLSLVEIGLKDEQMLSLISCLSKKGILFPKLKNIDLASNYLQTKGISGFMSLDLPSIQNVGFYLNKDVQFFNSVFRYKASKRLMSFNSLRNYFSGIDKDIDKKHTKRIQTFSLESESIRSTDIQELSKFQFDSLLVFIAAFQKINDCQSLEHIRNINLHTSSMMLYLSKAEGISSMCLSNKSSQFVLPSNVGIMLSTPYGQARKFAQFFFNPGQILSSLSLTNTYISDEKMRSIVQTSNMQKIEMIELQSNDLSDYSIKQMLGKQYRMLKSLDLSRNERITSEGLSLMNNIVYSSLQQIVLDGTKIGDKGIEYLVRNQFPKLFFLKISNVDLTRKGVMLLGSLKAPNLVAIDLSCNQLSGEDISMLDTEKFPVFQAVVAYPMLSDKQVEMLTLKFNREAMMKGQTSEIKVTIITDKWYEDIQRLENELKSN